MKISTRVEDDPTSPNFPIKVSELANMYRRRTLKNDRPYDVAVIKLNNEKIEEWYQKVLLRIADSNGNIPTGRTADCARFFLEGKELQQMQKFKDHFLKCSVDQFKFWMEYLNEHEIEDIYALGTSIVERAWATITLYLKDHFSDLRWEKIFSKSDDPYDWDIEANANPHLMHGRPLPFGLSIDTLNEVQEKVRVVLSNGIKPKNTSIPHNTVIKDKKEFIKEFKVKVYKNEKPMVAKVIELNNEKVDRWARTVFNKLEGDIQRGTALTYLLCYLEGLEIMAYRKYRDQLPRYTEEMARFWVDFLREVEVEDLYTCGLTVTSHAWSCINEYIKEFLTEVRWSKIYEGSDDPLVWSKNNEEIHGGELPLGLTNDIMTEMKEKVTVVFNYPMQPR